MAKKRVHEIAKERGITSKEALEVLRNAGLEVKVAASSVDEADAARAFGNGAGASTPAPEPIEAAAQAQTTEAEPAAQPSTEGDDGAAAPEGGGDGGQAQPQRGGGRPDGSAGGRGGRVASQREGGPPQPRPDIRPPEGEPVRRAGRSAAATRAPERPEAERAAGSWFRRPWRAAA